MDSLDSNSFSLGVDLVEFAKAKDFYKTHHKRLDTFFSLEEISFIKKNRTPHKALAALMAAKEAAFKALNLSWMGPQGFKKIQITPVKKGFVVASNRLRHLNISVRMKQKFVLAWAGQCAGI